MKKQVGAAEIDPANRTATAYVSRSTDLQNVPVKELKLGPAGITTYSPEIEGTTSFETVRLAGGPAHRPPDPGGAPPQNRAADGFGMRGAAG